jgi:predicted PurR-regulated permease PerM
MKQFFQTRQQGAAFAFAMVISIAFALQFLPFITPITLAIIFAFAIEPKLSRISAVHKSRKKWQTVGILLGLMLAVVFPVCFIFYKIVNRISAVAREGVQNSQFVQSLMRLKDAALEKASMIYPGLADNLSAGNDSITKYSEGAVKFSAALIAGLPDFVMSFLVFLAALYIFIVFSKQIKKFATDSKILAPHKLKKTIEVSQKICFSTLFSSIVIGAIQATTVALGGLIFGYHEVFLVFIITFFVSFIPVIGAGPVAFVLAVNSFIVGETGSGVGLVVVGMVAGIVDNLIKPYILSSSDDDDTHPLIAILVLVGSVIVYGFVGLLLGPVLLKFFTHLVPVLLEIEDPDQPASK